LSQFFLLDKNQSSNTTTKNPTLSDANTVDQKSQNNQIFSLNGNVTNINTSKKLSQSNATTACAESTHSMNPLFNLSNTSTQFQNIPFQRTFPIQNFSSSTPTLTKPTTTTTTTLTPGVSNFSNISKASDATNQNFTSTITHNQK
jgi:hypothetical protein